MEKHIVFSMVYFSRLKNMMLINRLEYVESMVGNLLPLPSLQRLDWTMCHVLHSGWLVMALNLKFSILSQYQKIKVLICILSTGFQLLGLQLLKLPSERVNYFNT
jgi:hypothetical protein